MSSLSDDSYDEDGFDFTPNLPYAPLGPLCDNFRVAAMSLEAHAEREEQICPIDAWHSVRYWERTVFKVVNDLERAEEKRIEDIKKRIDLDMEIEKEHQKRLQTMDRMWEAKMAAREEEWKAKIEAQKQMYQAKLAELNHTQEAASIEMGEREQLASAAVSHSEPHPAMAQGEDVRALKASQLKATTKLESNSLGLFGKRKRVGDGSTHTLEARPSSPKRWRNDTTDGDEV